MKKVLFLLVLISGFAASAQFDGTALTPGSLAIHRDSNVFVAWANTCQVDRGWLNISDKAQGLTSFGANADGTGIADDFLVVSLGDSGVATLAFNPSIADGLGPDFAVFENSFSHFFLELAFVEVSSNGVDFFRFPATSNYPTDNQIGPFDDVCDPTTLHNLAGKYRGQYGTPFDLSELDSIQELDISQITHVRLIDVVGSIDPQYGSTDKNGNLINDPFPTAFESGGFDLDAIGVIHQGPLSTASPVFSDLNVYPNPLSSGDQIRIQSEVPVEYVRILSVSGALVFEGNQNELETYRPESGAYIIQVQTKQHLLSQPLTVVN